MSRPVVLSDHAKAEAERRHISESTVMQVAAAPEQRVRLRADREVRQSRIADPVSGTLYLVRAIVDLQANSDTIVTVYRTSKVRKYWRDR